MISVSRKYLAEFVTRMVQHNKLNYLRYHVALGLIDEKGEGRVSHIEAYKTISEKFGLNTRTVRRTLNDMVKYEWLDSGPNHFYYRKQERIALRYDCELTSRRAVAYSWEDVSGDIVHWRSVTMDAVLAIHGDNPTITREKLHELYGWSRQTQRKYNRMAGTGTRENYAALSQMESEYDLQRAQELRPYAFMFNDANGELFNKPGQRYVMAQIANTYNPKHNRTKRRIRALCNKRNGQRAIRRRVFVEQPSDATVNNDVKALKVWEKDTGRDVFYLRKGNSHVGLWGHIAPQNPNFF